LAKPENGNKESETPSDQRIHNGASSKIDKTVLTISEPKTDPIEGAFALRGSATLSHLREIAKPRPSRPLHTIQGPWAQGQ
jgi:hypothetical protein